MYILNFKHIRFEWEILTYFCNDRNPWFIRNILCRSSNSCITRITFANSLPENCIKNKRRSHRNVI